VLPAVAALAKSGIGDATDEGAVLDIGPSRGRRGWEATLVGRLVWNDQKPRMGHRMANGVAGPAAPVAVSHVTFRAEQRERGPVRTAQASHCGGSRCGVPQYLSNLVANLPSDLVHSGREEGLGKRLVAMI
jgi:hypothetical protein